MLAGHCVKTYNQTRETIALSSGESEFYRIVKDTTMGLGTKGLLGDLGVEAKVQVNADSSAAKSIASRRGGEQGSADPLGVTGVCFFFRSISFFSQLISLPQTPSRQPQKTPRGGGGVVPNTNCVGQAHTEPRRTTQRTVVIGARPSPKWASGLDGAHIFKHVCFYNCL